MRKKIVAFLMVFSLLITYIPVTSLAKESNQLLEGKTISIIGDSISTYMGYSDCTPITGEENTYRYGEPYYGPQDSDCHNTELTVNDTWWMQSANALGAEILVNSSGNSTGLFHASYPGNSDWQQYLQEMLVYKSRPYYLGTEDKNPDIIAIYIGSNDVAKASVSEFGNIKDVDFDTLIVENSDGTYNYQIPTTVAEAYCIMLHKITVTYPNSELYCFTVVPNSGGHLELFNQRLQSVCLFNDMIKGVATYYNANIVDVFEAFELDETVTQEMFETFQSYFYNDPHPNKEGFDVISEAFTNALLEESHYITQVETTAGNMEYIDTTITKNNGVISKKAIDFVTESKMKVDYEGVFGPDGEESSYFVGNETETYQAQGGHKKTYEQTIPNSEILIPLSLEENNELYLYGEDAGLINKEVIVEDEENKGIYEYIITRREQQSYLHTKTTGIQLIDTHEVVLEEGMKYLYSDIKATDTNGMIIAEEVVIPEEVIYPEGYDYVYVGSDQLSNYWAAYVYDRIDPSYADEPAVYETEDAAYYVGVNHSVFEKRNLLVPQLIFPDQCVEGSFPAKYDSIQQFTLLGKNGEKITAYCADRKTSAVEGYGYKMANLHDSTYYSEAEAKMIYEIAKNGYWGTESGYGSLEELKENLAATNNFSDEELLRITDGMAMTAMQYAIWSNSNIMDHQVFVNAYYTNRAVAPSKAANQDDVDLIFKIYFYLMNLQPQTTEKTTADTVINSDNFLSKITFKTTSKPENHKNNQDLIDTNDVYQGDLSFTLKVKPSEENGDQLAMVIYDENDVIAIGRIVGELQEGEIQLIDQGNNTYTLEDICLEEGTENIRFVMKGYQNLDKAAYLFTSEIKDGTASQTMVAVAEGQREVNVSLNLEFELEITDEIISKERVYRTEQTKTIPEDPEDPEDPPKTNTGDDAMIYPWLFMFILSGFSLLVISYKKYKKA